MISYVLFQLSGNIMIISVDLLDVFHNLDWIYGKSLFFWIYFLKDLSEEELQNH